MKVHHNRAIQVIGSLALVLVVAMGFAYLKQARELGKLKAQESEAAGLFQRSRTKATVGNTGSRGGPATINGLKGPGALSELGQCLATCSAVYDPSIAQYANEPSRLERQKQLKASCQTSCRQRFPE